MSHEGNANVVHDIEGVCLDFPRTVTLSKKYSIFVGWILLHRPITNSYVHRCKIQGPTFVLVMLKEVFIACDL